MSTHGRSWCAVLAVVTCLALHPAPAAAGDRALLVGVGSYANAELLEFVRAQSTADCASHDKCGNLDPQLESKAQALGESAVAPEKLDANGNGQGAYLQAGTPNLAHPIHQDANAVSAVSDIIGKTETGDVRIAID